MQIRRVTSPIFFGFFVPARSSSRRGEKRAAAIFIRLDSEPRRWFFYRSDFEVSLFFRSFELGTDSVFQVILEPSTSDAANESSNADGNESADGKRDHTLPERYAPRAESSVKSEPSGVTRGSLHAKEADAVEKLI